MLFHCVSLPLKAIDTEIKQSPGRRLEIVLVLKAECMQEPPTAYSINVINVCECSHSGYNLFPEEMQN